MCRRVDILYFFFFQAEDGIRVYKVTGVQTCALPIWPALSERADHGADVRLPAGHGARSGRGQPPVQPGAGQHLRARMGQGGALSTGLSPLWSRRQWLQGLAGGAALGLSGCTPTPPRLEDRKSVG